MARIDGDNGNNRLKGTAGADEIRGQGGNDVLKGLGGDDDLRGGDGADKLIGGVGNDRLRGDHGDDTVTGGSGNDRFIFNLQGDTDTVTDFTQGDSLDMSNFHFASFDEAMSHAQQVGADVVFTDLAANGESVILKNVDIATLDSGDFILFG